MNRFCLIILGIIASFSAARAQRLKVDFVTSSIVRVQWVAEGAFQDNGTGVCVYPRQAVDVKRKDRRDYVEYTSSDLVVKVCKAQSAVTFIDRKTGKVLLQENPALPHEAEPVVRERIIYDDNSAHMEETANGMVTVKDIIRRDTVGTGIRYRVHFSFPGGKALYGLGCHMEDYMNFLGKTVWLTQHNLKAMVPMLLSPGGFGVLFDAGCAMKFTSSVSSSPSSGGAFSMQMEAAKELDYYFVKGQRMDDVVAGYRYLTGKVSLMPRYLFGYTQSKERYVSSDDIINTLREYRRRHVPIDMIVQDWNYWPEGWGYMKMNPKYYPDPKALADSVHAMHAKLMVSIWPNPQYCPQERDFRSRGFMLGHSVYDAFNPKARELYWKYANDEFFSKGFDAWWCDCSEPVDGDWNKTPEPQNGIPYSWNDHQRRWELNKAVLEEALGAERSSLFSLYHAQGIYENQRSVTADKRVVNLTRSSYAGQQRYGTIVWNGDTHASWQSFRQQIPAGLNYMATGNPYWTVDVGSFFVRNNPQRWFWAGEFQDGVKDDAYKEYYTRMFQWATFLPMLRSHGTDTPREIWRFGEQGTPYYDAILSMINLRYALIPYIYSMSARQTTGSYTMARLLAFDYPEDDNVLDMKDEYMFGDILVCPVTRPLSESRSRRVYLPEGNKWTYYWDGTVYDGGQWLELPVEIGVLPLFVRNGSILTTAEATEYSAAQMGKDVEINVYPGADARFVLYEDEGDGYGYERGQRSMIHLSWNDKKRRLTISGREGSFPGMPQRRTFIVKTPQSRKTVTYDGSAVSVTL